MLGKHQRTVAEETPARRFFAMCGPGISRCLDETEPATIRGCCRGLEARCGFGARSDMSGRLTPLARAGDEGGDGILRIPDAPRPPDRARDPVRRPRQRPRLSAAAAVGARCVPVLRHIPRDLLGGGGAGAAVRADAARRRGGGGSGGGLVAHARGDRRRGAAGGDHRSRGAAGLRQPALWRMVQPLARAAGAAARGRRRRAARGRRSRGVARRRRSGGRPGRRPRPVRCAGAPRRPA